MKEKEMMEFCTELKRQAEQAELEAFEIYAVCGESFSVTVLDGEIEKYNVNDFTGVSFRVMQDGKMGYASTTVLEPSGIGALIAAARDNASVIESAQKQFIFAGEERYCYPKVYGEGLSEVSTEDKIRMAKELEKKTLSLDQRVSRTNGSYVSSSESVRVILNSHGLSLKETGNSIAAYVIPIAQIGDEMNSGFSFGAGYSLADIHIDQIAAESVKNAVDLCGAKSIPGKNMKIVLENRAAADLLAVFCPVFFADNAQKKLSLLAGKEESKIASDCVSITDDSLLDYGFGSRAFDDEGVAGRTTRVIENGVLKSLLYNLRTAAKAGASSTGNASKAGYASPVSTSVTNFYIAPGKRDKQALIQSAGNGLLICDVSGLHSGANAATGDFSLTAQGYLIENGQLGRGVSGITVSGNFYRLLTEIEETADDLFISPFGAAVGSPSLLLAKEMAVAGE